MATLLWESFVILLGGFIQGITGFGFAMIALPALAFFLPLTTVVPLLVLFGLVTNLFILWETHQWIRLSEIRVITFFGLVGIPFGVAALRLLNPSLLKVAIGLLVTVTAIAMAYGFKMTFRHRIFSSGITGFLSGFLNGSISMSGPPIVLFLTNEDSPKVEFRANLTLYGAVTNIVTIVSFVFSGMMESNVLRQFGILLPSLVIGMVLGMFATRKIAEDLFRKIVLALLAITGIVTVALTLRG